MQVRVWVPAAVMRRAQATMVQGTGPGSSGLTLTVLSDFQESSVPLQVSTACLAATSQAACPAAGTPCSTWWPLPVCAEMAILCQRSRFVQACLYLS